MRRITSKSLTAAGIASVALSCAPAEAGSRFGGKFWDRWGDGHAEVASYDLTYPRYGELRTGTAVTIFVTETFSESARVKADPGVHPAADEFPVMKLNLVQDFPTGIYDYNLMTSAFSALTARLGRPEGSAAKVSFSAQEWCGHIWLQLRPERGAVRETFHSYFDREADREASLDYPEGGLLEDLLLLWARGFAAPFLEPGESRTVPVLRSAEIARLTHVPLEWETGSLSRSPDSREVTVPAGTFAAETMTAKLSGGRTWEFLVEAAEPRRLLRWSATDGRVAELVAVERLQYWQMNDPASSNAVERIGLEPRPARTP
jgi:hypothetical protein